MKSVVFCSSQRFAKELSVFLDELHSLARDRGITLTVMHPEFEIDNHALQGLHEKDRLKNDLYRAEVAGKVYDHLFRKVKVADVCFVFNKDGYVGPNVVGEIFAAATLGKMIYALEPNTFMGNYPHDMYEELTPKKLIHGVVATPAELLTRLT